MKHIFPALLIALTCSLTFASEKPNVIFIMADDLGYGDLGCYGQKVIQTPRIDRLSAEGTRFTQFYAGSTVCAPSRCVLMTGLHTGHATIRGNKMVPLRPEDVTVAEIFKQAGYATGIVGKWGCGEAYTTGIPNRQGFDFWYGYLNQWRAHNYYPDYLWRNEQPEVLLGNNILNRPQQYSHDLFTAEALQFIEQNKSRPFFLYLAYTIPHANNELTRCNNGNGMEVPDYGPYKSKDWAKPQKGHAAMISRLDGDIGRIVKKLKGADIDNNTLIFFTSDNGPHHEGGADPAFFDSNGPLRGIKRDLYEGGIRVPMIARWPGKVKAGVSSDQIWAMWDFLPTMADLVGIEAPAGLDGISMLPALKGKSQRDHEFLYWEFHERGFSQAVRMGDWKAVHKDRGPLELYNLKEDIGEERNVAGNRPAVVAKIEACLAKARTDSKHWPGK